MVSNAQVEDVFCSKIRVRILKFLLQLGRLNVSDISHRLGINYRATLEHLKILKDKNVIDVKFYGRVRLCSLSESPRTQAIKRVLEAWEPTRNLH
jgi:DNA-binding transcriptional ArsR family regulator